MLEENQLFSNVSICLHCGATLNEDQLFCTKCGTPRGEEKTEPCLKCGEKLKYGQKFCPRCGQKKIWSIEQSWDYGIQGSKSILQKIWKYIIVGVVIIAIVVLSILLVPKIFKSVEVLCAEGNYEKAYAKASKEEKESVLFENITAVLSADIAGNLYNLNSFELLASYYYEYINIEGEISKYMLLSISSSSANIGFNTTETQDYRLYKFNESENKWCVSSSNADLIIRSMIIRDGTRLHRQSISRINAQFESGTLEDVELLIID